MESIVLLILNTVVQVFGFLVLLRLLLQLVRADYGNPLSQGIIRVTDPVLAPLRRLLPSWGSLDNASLLVLILLFTLYQYIIRVMLGYNVNFMTAFAYGLYDVGTLWLNIYRYGLLIWIIAGFVAPGSYNPALMLVGQILNPIMKPARRIMPNMGGFDFSPILVFLVIQILQSAILPAAVSLLL
jgi:YggT family protein